MKRSISLFVSAMLCAAFVYAESGDSLTIVATVPEKTPSFSIVQNVVGEDLSVSVIQDEDARYRGALFLEIPVSGWTFENAVLSERVLCRVLGNVVRIEVMYDGYHPKGVLANMELRKGAATSHQENLTFVTAPGLVFVSP